MSVLMLVGAVASLVVAGGSIVMLSTWWRRKSRRRRARALMPQWPHDWPPYAEFLDGRLPGWSWGLGLSRVPLREWPARLGRWTLQAVALGVRPPTLSASSLLRWLVDVLYWGPQRISWRARPGFLALPSGRYAFGTGAVRVGLLQPRNWIERQSPLEVWIPRELIYRHYALAGPTGSGKTTTIGVALPFYAAYSGQTVVINDVKLANGGGEFFAWFADHWRAHGASAVNFNPWTPSESLACEPIHAATREQLDIIVSALVKNAKSGKSGDGGGNMEFFTNAAKQLLTALVIALRYVPRRYCSLPCLYRIVAMGARPVMEFLAGISKDYPSLDASEAAARRLLSVSDAELEAEWEDTHGTRQPRAADMTAALALLDRSGYELQQWVREARAQCWQHGQQIAQPFGDAWAARWTAFRTLYHTRRATWDEAIAGLGTVVEQPETTFANIAMTAQNSLHFFQTPELQRAFSRPEFELRDVIERPTLFVIGAPQAKWAVGAKFTASLFWDLVMNLVQGRGKEIVADHQHRVDVVCLMDEMPALGIEDLARILATVRSYRMPIIGIYQSDNQLRQAYGEDYGTVLDNFIAQGTLFGSGGDTAKRTADRVGEAVMLKEQKSSSSQGMGGGGGSSSVSSPTAERVKRLTDQDVTEMRVNGDSLGEKAALFTGKNAPPFVYQQISWWDDPVIREYIGAAYDRGRGQWKLPEQRTPFVRAPLFEVETTVRRSAHDPWVYRLTATGERIPDAHAHDPYRETVDVLAPPPGGKTLFELTDPPFDPRELGITPVTTDQLQAIVAKKLGQTAPAPTATPAGAPSASEAGPAASVGDGTTLSPEAVRTHLDLLEALVQSDAGLPNYTAMPLVTWEDRRFDWREIAEAVTRADAERQFVVPEGNLPGLHLDAQVLPLEFYLANAVHSAMDFPSFVFKWMKKIGVAPPETTNVQAVTANMCDLIQHVAGGVAASPLVWLPYLEIEERAPAAVRKVIRAFLERARDRLAAVPSPEVLVPVWADLRGELIELTPPELDAETTHLIVHAECVIDYGAMSRAQHMDLTAFGDEAHTPLPMFRTYLEQSEYPMPAKEALRQACLSGQGAALRNALARFPHRRAAAERLAAAVRTHDAEGMLQANVTGNAGALAVAP